MRSSRAVRVLKIFIGLLAGLFVLFAATGFYLYRLSLTLPDLAHAPSALKTARTSIVYASDGSVLAKWHGAEDRTLVGLQDMPENLRHAVVAVEDRRFYEHHGVDVQAIARALKTNASAGAAAEGGSTITQQLVKLMFTGGRRTLTRKVREALLAYELENTTDKDDVLETYMNVVYFGHGAYGAEAAARTFFGKGASELTLPESATLAAVIKSPAKYSPLEHPLEAKQRRDVVLGLMREQGMIGAEEFAEAKAAPLTVSPPKEGPTRAPYFVEWVRRDLSERLGDERVYKGGLRVFTSLDPALQAEAEKAANSVLPSPRDPSVALVTVQHSTGRVLAMVGGRDFSRDKFNLAVQAKRQPGSAFKPFVLVAALESGIGPADTFSAGPYEVRVKDGVWRVENYENEIKGGWLTLSKATAWSVNAVYARLIIKVGADKVVDAARRMGITSPLEPNPAIALGGLSQGVSPLEMASAYGTIADGGIRREPTGVVRVLDDRGKAVYAPESKGERAISKAVAVQASLMLHEVVERGTGVGARIGQWAAGKTGTTQSYRDAWFVGYSGDLATAVWVGYPGAQVAMTNVHGRKVSGGSFPASIWGAYMGSALRKAGEPAARPAKAGAGSSAVRATVCADTFLLANKRCPNPIELYLPPDLVPKAVCGKH